MPENHHNCNEHFQKRRATRSKPYHFFDSGLPNIWLASSTGLVKSVVLRLQRFLPLNSSWT